MPASSEVALEVAAVVADAHRTEWARVLASTARVTRDLDLAEECTQDAYERALEVWPPDGVPRRPGAWLTTVAANRARDLLRREGRWRRVMPMLVTEESEPGPDDKAEPPLIDDDRLRLVFTCCHPALARDAQVALTLRLVCGLTTDEVARAFLVPPTTMAARITRGKKKIATARIPFRVPAGPELEERVDAVLEVVHLVFTTGHTAPSGGDLVRGSLVDVALRLGRLLHSLLPRDQDVTALLALMLLVDARRRSRVSPNGDMVLLADQDRSLWDREQIVEGVDLLVASADRARPGRFSVQAAIAAAHAEAPSWGETDWPEIVGLYDVLARLWPSPVVELNRVVAVGFRDGPHAGLHALDPLLDEPLLAAYGYVSATRADFLRQLGRESEAVEAYEEAIALTDNDVERAFLVRRVLELAEDRQTRPMSDQRPDLAPAVDRLLGVAAGVSDDQLGNVTPCDGRTVSQLVSHVAGLLGAFRAAADKELGPWTDTNPDAGGGWSEAEDGWRETLPERGSALATAWSQSAAWEGMTRAGGVDLPGEVAGLVALSEVSLHGWDLAKATGQEYACDDETAAVLEGFVGGFDAVGTPGLYGPAVEVSSSATTFERVLGATGRDPGWARPAD